MNDAEAGREWAAPGAPAPLSPSEATSLPPSAPPQPPPTMPDAGAPLAPPPPIVVAPQAPAMQAPTYRSWQPGIIPLRPISFGEFLGVPFKAMRFNRAVVVGGPLIFVGISMLLLAAAMWLVFNDPSLGLFSPTGSFTGVQASTVIVGVIALAAIVFADALSCAVVASGVARSVLGERITVGVAMTALRKRFGAVLLLWLLALLALLLAYVPGAALIGVGIAANDGGSIALGFFLVLGLGIAAGIPIYVISSVARCVAVLEDKGAVASIRRTVSVIRGRFWWSVLIIGLTYILVSIATGMFQQVLSLVGSLGFVLGASGEWFGTVIAIGVLVLGAAISYVITYAYMGSIYAFVYIDARIRHEGFDLDLARAAEARRA